MVRILFVCMGNICRSPLAEAVMRAFVVRARMSSSVEIDSAGTHTYPEGEQPDQRARKVAASRGYDLSGLRARRVTGDDYQKFDRILAMDRQNLSFLKRHCPPEYQSRLGLFLDCVDGVDLGEIPDPYYGGAAGFERVLDLCEQAAKHLVADISDDNRGNGLNGQGRL
jgi:protein-tyrosine phosphatase